MIDYYNEGSQMAWDWLKVNILYQFYENDSSFLYDYQKHSQEKSCFAYVYKTSLCSLNGFICSANFQVYSPFYI